MEKARAAKFMGGVQVAEFGGADKCDKYDPDGDDGILYWCPGDHCCRHPASNNPPRDGDWFCCDESQYPNICAQDEWACDA